MTQRTNSARRPAGYGVRALRYGTISVLAVLLIVLTSGASSASIVFNISDQSSKGPAGDGPVSARATFTAVAGGIQVTLENLQGGILADGQEISQFQFIISGGLGLPDGNFTSILTAAGLEVNVDKGGTFSSPTPAASGNNHWSGTSSGGNVTLDTLNGVGGQPTHLITGPSPFGDPSSSISTHNPNFYESATFTIPDAAITASTVLTQFNITNVLVGFGTGGGKYVPGTPLQQDVLPNPEPASLAIWSILGLAGLVYRRTKNS